MGKSDKDFARLLQMMQRQGSANNPIGIELGVMTGSDTCKLGELDLDKDDLLFNEMLLKPILTELKFDIQSNGGTTHTHEWTDKSKYIEPLKDGDMVALSRLDELEKYLVICKVVSA